MSKINNMRKNGIIGMIENTTTTLQFSEWWNGEGLDFVFDEDKKISLHLDEIELLCIAAYASEYMDMEEIIERAKELQEK